VDTASWLASLGLEQYKQLFHKNDLNRELLHHLIGDDLKEIGATLLGHLQAAMSL